MILAIDIGNSNVVIGTWLSEQWTNVWRLPTLVQQDALIYYQEKILTFLLESGYHPESVTAVVCSTVVPDLREPFLLLGRTLTGKSPLMVDHSCYHLLRFATDNPAEMGSDLFANAYAAFHMAQSDCIIVDFGTALTFTTLTADGLVKGVAIAPGLKTALSALFQKTAQLPEVPLQLPDSALGINTQHAIQSGVLIGYVGLVRHMLETIQQETGRQHMTIATGGLSSILQPLTTTFDRVEPHLTLDGLRHIRQAING